MGHDPPIFGHSDVLHEMKYMLCGGYDDAADTPGVGRALKSRLYQSKEGEAQRNQTQTPLLPWVLNVTFHDGVYPIITFHQKLRMLGGFIGSGDARHGHLDDG